MGAWVGEELGIPIVTVELPPGAERESPDALWEAHGPALLEALAWAEDRSLSGKSRPKERG